MTTEVDNFQYEKKVFNKYNLSFLILVIITLLTSFLGIGLILAITIFAFIFKPKLYESKIFQKPSYKLLKALSSRRIGYFLSKIPGISLQGKWFIEYNSENVLFDKPKDLFKFILVNWLDFLVIPVGIFITIFRLFIGLSLIELTFSDDTYDFMGIVLENPFITISVLSILPIIFAFYFNLVFIWKDSEIKIADWKMSSKGKNIYEIRKLSFAGDEIRSIIALLAGISSIQWIIKFNRETLGVKSDDAVLYAILTFITIFITIGGVMIFQGIMFYRSESFNRIVNSLRNKLRDEFKEKPTKNDEDNQISVYSSQIIPIDQL